MEQGERDAKRIIDETTGLLGDVTVDYVELVDGATMKPVERVQGPVMLAVAAFVGSTRLIDNIRFEEIGKQG
jgi:pantothenate synthetase